jgi:hypothetical protein
VDPEVAPGGVDDRPREPVVVGVRVRADDQPHVGELEPDLGERQFELALTVVGRHPGVEEHDPAVGGDGPSVAMRDPRPRQRQP